MSEEGYTVFDGNVDDDDGLLRQTQQMRVRIANEIGTVPKAHTDAKLMNTLKNMLDGIDKQILGKRRAAAQEKSAAAAGDIANQLNAWVTNTRGAKIERHDDVGENNTGYQPPIPNVPVTELNDGLLAPVGEKIDVEQIMAAGFANRVIPSEDDEY